MRFTNWSASVRVSSSYSAVDNAAYWTRQRYILFSLQVLSTNGMMLRNDITRVTMRKVPESSQEPLAPAMNLTTTPELLMCINFCGVLYFLCVTSLIVAVSFTITLPSQYTGVAFWIRLLIALFILVQVLQAMLMSFFNLLCHCYWVA